MQRSLKSFLSLHSLLQYLQDLTLVKLFFKDPPNVTFALLSASNGISSVFKCQYRIPSIEPYLRRAVVDIVTERY